MGPISSPHQLSKSNAYCNPKEWRALLINVLSHYQQQGKYHLREFAVMPNHFHLMITPIYRVTLEKAVQLIKGGFSYRVKKELGFAGEIWQTSFYDRRVRDAEEYGRFRHYIHMNPRAARLSSCAGGVRLQFGKDDIG